MVLFLAGGGNEKDSFELDSKFVNMLDRSKKLMYIPLARNAPFEPCFEWISKSLGQHDFSEIFMVEDLAKIDFASISRNFSGIYIGGGDTSLLLYRIKEAGFLDVLIDFASCGGIVYGGSAGAIIMGESIKTGTGQSSDLLENDLGLDLLNGYCVRCHWDGSEVEGNDFPCLYIPEKSGLVVDGFEVLVVGSEAVGIFDGHSFKLFNPGEKFSLYTI